MGSSTTKYFLGGGVVALVAAYALWSGNHPTPIPPLATVVAASSTPASAGSYKDGTYTGQTADAFYGTVQVAATIQNGALTSIQFPKYPSDPGHTIMMSRYALPRLAREAIVAQNANVQVVSGATQTSQAFMQSLASALTEAH